MVITCIIFGMLNDASSLNRLKTDSFIVFIVKLLNKKFRLKIVLK